MSTPEIIQPRRNTAAGAAANNRVLYMGERGYETDTERWKTGDGATNYNDLPYDDDPAKIAGSTVTGRAVLTGDAAAGRTALGAGAVGATVFTAASQDAGRGALDAGRVGAAGYNPMDTGIPLANAIGDGDDHPLSERFATLGEAQAVFPFVTTLAEQIDESAFTRGLTHADVILAPAGVYKLRLGLAWQSGKRLVGPAVFEPAADVTGTAMFRANNISGWVVDGPTFDAGGAMATSVRIHGGSADFLVEDTVVTGATDVGVNVADCVRGTFRRVRSVENGTGDTNDANWWILGTDHNFIDCAGAAALGSGWRILGTSTTSARNRFTGCRGSNNTRYGFYGAGTRADAPTGYVFTDCDAIGNGSSGVFSGFALHMLNLVRGKGLRASSNTEHGLVLQDLYGGQVEVSGSGNGRELVRLQADFSVAEDALSGARHCEVFAVAEGNGVGAFTQRGPVSIEGSCHDITIRLIAIDNAGVPVKIPVHAGYADPYNIEVSGGVFSGNAGGDDPVNDGSGSWWGSNIVDGVRKTIAATPVAFGGTGAISASDARANLGLIVGVDVRALNPRVLTDTNVASWTFDADDYDVVRNTGLTTGVTVNAPGGTPADGQLLHLTLQGTASRAITWNAAFEAGVFFPLPAATNGTNQLDVVFMYNAATSKWRIRDVPGVSAATAGSVVARDGNANIVTDNFVNSADSTVSAAGTTAMLVNSKGTQIVTGSTTQTLTLPTTSVPICMEFQFINLSSGDLTVNASGGALVATLTQGQTLVVKANQATPTLAAHWSRMGGTAA